MKQSSHSSDSKSTQLPDEPKSRLKTLSIPKERTSRLSHRCPYATLGFSLILSVVNTESFQIFLDHMQKEIGSGRVVMIMDNASWHKTKALRWGRIEPLYLPPYSPDFNPIERIWLVSSYFLDFYRTAVKRLKFLLFAVDMFDCWNKLSCLVMRLFCK